jgi:hypothetical protein
VFIRAIRGKKSSAYPCASVVRFLPLLRASVANLSWLWQTPR